MRRADNTPNGGSITVEVGRFGESPSEFVLAQDATVGQALETAGITLSGRERIWVNGEAANTSDLLDDNDVVNVVSPKEAGA